MANKEALGKLSAEAQPGGQSAIFNWVRSQPVAIQENLYLATINSLSRLAAHSQKKPKLQPTDRYRVALSITTKGRTFRDVAAEFDIHHQSVAIAQRDVEASLIYAARDLLDPVDREVLLADSSVKTAFEKVRTLETEVHVIQAVLDDPEIAKLINEQPPLKNALTCYQQYSTLEPLFNSLGISYTQKSMSYYEKQLRDFVFDPRKDITLLSFFQKLLFAHYRKTIIAWKRPIAEAAVLLFSQPLSSSDPKHSVLRSARTLLQLILEEEYSHPPIRGLTFLVNAAGKSPNTVGDIALLQSLNTYWVRGELPNPLLSLLNHFAIDENINTIGETTTYLSAYPAEGKRVLISALKSVIENVLAAPIGSDIHLDLLSYNRTEALRRIRQIILEKTHPEIEKVL